MIKKLNGLGDRMLGMLLPKATASAALCPGRYMGYWSGCEWFCYRYLDHSTKYKWCGSGCQVVCYDCCS